MGQGVSSFHPAASECDGWHDTHCSVLLWSEPNLLWLTQYSKSESRRVQLSDSISIINLTTFCWSAYADGLVNGSRHYYSANELYRRKPPPLSRMALLDHKLQRKNESGSAWMANKDWPVSSCWVSILLNLWSRVSIHAPTIDCLVFALGSLLARFHGPGMHMTQCWIPLVSGTILSIWALTDFCLFLFQIHRQPGKHWYFKQSNPPSPSRLIISEELQELFLQRGITTALYIGLSEMEERDIFRLVQEGKPLTIGEKMQAAAGP